MNPRNSVRVGFATEICENMPYFWRNFEFGGWNFEKCVLSSSDCVWNLGGVMWNFCVGKKAELPYSRSVAFWAAFSARIFFTYIFALTLLPAGELFWGRALVLSTQKRRPVKRWPTKLWLGQRWLRNALWLKKRYPHTVLLGQIRALIQHWILHWIQQLRALDKVPLWLFGKDGSVVKKHLPCICLFGGLALLSLAALCMISAGDSFVPSGLRASGCGVLRLSSCRLLLPGWLTVTRQSSPCGGWRCLVVHFNRTSVSSPCGGWRCVSRFDSVSASVNDWHGRLRNPCLTTPRASSPPLTRRRETFAPIFVYLQTAVPAFIRYSRLGVVERCWLWVPEDSGCRFRVRLEDSEINEFSLLTATFIYN